MSVRFNGQAGLILVTAQIWGPSGDTYAQLALDRLPIVCHTLPSSAVIDGLLGLDFLRGQSLTIDFRNGLLTLT